MNLVEELMALKKEKVKRSKRFLSPGEFFIYLSVMYVVLSRGTHRVSC
jgi:hypothetical protein